MKVSNFINKLSIIGMFSCLSLSACSPGSQNPANQPLLLGTLPNGSAIMVSQSTFSISNGGSTSGSLGSFGGYGKSSYIMTMAVSPSGPVLSTNPSPCIFNVYNPNQRACQLLFAQGSAVAGNYAVRVSYAPVNNSIAQDSLQDNINTFSQSFNLVLTSDPQPTPTPTPTPGPTPTPVVPGSMVLMLSQPTTLIGESIPATVTLSGSSGITQPVSVTIRSLNPQVAYISSSACNLTSANNLCSFKINGLESGSTSIAVSAIGYAAESAPLTVSPANFVYVSNFGGFIAICRLDLHGSFSDCSTESAGGIFMEPAGISLHNSHVYITNLESNTMVVCAANRNNLLSNCAAESANGAFANPLNIAFNNSLAYITNFNFSAFESSNVAICNLESNGSFASCLNESGGGLFVANTGVAFNQHYGFVSNIIGMVITNSILDNGLLSPESVAYTGSVEYEIASMTVTESNAYLPALEGNSIRVCSISESGTISACEAESANGAFIAPFTMAVLNHSAYISNLEGNYISHCTLANNGGISNCVIESANGAFSGPAGVAIMQN